jgi:hypothetical protein
MRKEVTGVVILAGVALGLVLGFVAFLLGVKSKKRTEITVPHRLEPYGVYITVNPGGINDTTYTYDIGPYLK